MQWLVACLSLAGLALAGAEGANILVMLPLPMFSHINAYMPVVNALAARGHNVTMFSGVPIKNPVPNLTVIPVDYKMQSEHMKSRELAEASTLTKFFFPLIMMTMPLKMMREVTVMEPLQRAILDTDSRYDLVMTETFFMQEPMVAFGHKYSAPVVNLNPAELMSLGTYLTGNLNPYSYVPRKILGESTDRMGFLDRVVNTLGNLMDIVFAHVYYIPQSEAILKENFKYPGSESMPSLKEMLTKTSLTLCDAHYALGYPRPYHMNVIDMGGLTTAEVPRLSPELKKWMDEAEHGVIYFTTGSHLRAEDLNPETVKVLVTALGQLKQRVLWKWEGATLPGQPPNVKIAPWFPQNGILAHPKCKLFITHGGFHSLYESIYFEVPIVGLPIFADQPFNVRLAEAKGIGIALAFKGLTSEALVTAVNKVISDPKYKSTVKELASVLNDNPISRLDNVIYWIEYVIRHKGAGFLRPASVDLYWYQYLLLDVTVFLLAIPSLFIWAIFKCCSRRKSAKINKKKTPKQD